MNSSIVSRWARTGAYLLLLAALALGLALGTGSFSPALADKPTGFDSQGLEVAWQASSCTKIQDGTLEDSKGNLLVMGFDQFGYNYQAHEFNGTYDSSDRNLDGTYWGDTGDYVDDHLWMKWSDDWLSNTDCNGDGKLDRGVPESYSGSRGWLTNLVEGDYVDLATGNVVHYTDFVKIVWTGPGSPLWNEYTIIQENYNDPTGNYHFKLGAPGFGLNDQWTTLP